jgi:hypothetical protein
MLQAVDGAIRRAVASLERGRSTMRGVGLRHRRTLTRLVRLPAVIA